MSCAFVSPGPVPEAGKSRERKHADGPRAYITEWRARAPWIEDFQIEQDLVISGALVEIFSEPALAGGLASRGGTALYKVYLTPPARYSEDIGLVQVAPRTCRPLMAALRSVLDPWLGEARWKQSKGQVRLGYRFLSEDVPPMRLRLKVEINTREHFVVYGFAGRPFSVDRGGIPEPQISRPSNSTNCCDLATGSLTTGAIQRGSCPPSGSTWTAPAVR